MNDVVPRPSGADVIEAVITKGDLAKLNGPERTQYYAEVCRSIGLNPFTRPFEYIMLNGKLQLYARREATDQLRKLNGISLEVVSRQVTGDILTVHVRAKDKSGRTDEDFGSVNIAGLRGEALANAQMKALTKGKRRVTLSISGLGFIDESEIEDIPRQPGAPVSTRADLDAFAGVPPQHSLSHDSVRQEEPEPPPQDERSLRILEIDARSAAAQGTEALRRHMRSLTPEDRDRLAGLVGSRQKPGELLRLAQASDDALKAAEPEPEDETADPFGLVAAAREAARPRDESWWKGDLVVEGKNPREYQANLHRRVREARSAAEIEALRASNPAIDDLDRATKEAVLNELADRERELRQQE
jgi:hypothetical protein